MDILQNKLPKFIKKQYLKQMMLENKFHYIKYKNEVAGFYVLDEEKFKCLYIHPLYRHLGIATNLIKTISEQKQITICVTRRLCSIKRLIIRLNFKYTGKMVEGKYSILEVWISPK